MPQPTSPTLAFSASKILGLTEETCLGRSHLQGAQRRKCSTALLLIDVINDMEFPYGGDKLLRQTLPYGGAKSRH
jgi:hypothetical protein